MARWSFIGFVAFIAWSCSIQLATPQEFSWEASVNARLESLNYLRSMTPVTITKSDDPLRAYLLFPTVRLVEALSPGALIVRTNISPSIRVAISPSMHATANPIDFLQKKIQLIVSEMRSRAEKSLKIV